RNTPPNRSRHAVLASAWVAGLLLITFSPIERWAYTMRVDMLAIALELLGIQLALIGFRRLGFEYLAAIAFVLAAFTKQTAILGAIATFVVFVLRMPTRAWRAAAFAIVFGGLAFAVLTLATKGGFLQHTVLYN